MTDNPSIRTPFFKRYYRWFRIGWEIRQGRDPSTIDKKLRYKQK